MKLSAKAEDAKKRGKRIVWRTDHRRGRTCQFCEDLDGFSRRPGQAFGAHGGKMVYEPPAHPHCYCRVEVI